jgi:Ger(x)C family germination protein
MAVAVDKAKSPSPQAAAGNPPFVPRRTFRVTFQIANPAQLAGGEKGGGAGAKPFWNLTTASPSVFLAVREMSQRVDRIPYFEHLQVIVLGEEVARESIEPVMDFFRRNGEMHRRVEVMVAEGEARKVLSVAPVLQPLPTFYLVDVARLAETRAGHSVPNAGLTEVFQSLHGGLSFVVPRVKPGKQEAKVSGGAVIRQGRLAGWLGEVEAQGYRWVAGQMEAGVVKMRVPQGGDLAVFELCHARTRVIPQVRAGRVRFDVLIAGEGNISEYHGRKPISSPGDLERAAQEVARQIEAEAMAAVHRLQHYRADAVGFGQAVERRYPRVWRQLKDRWEDEVFPQARVTVRARVRVRLVGLHR